MPVDMLTTGQVARALGVTINTVKGWIRGGKMSAVRLPSGHHRIPGAELERVLGSLGEKAVQLNRPETSMAARRRSWDAFGRWQRTRTPEPVTVDAVLAFIDAMLAISRRGGPLSRRPISEKAAGIARMRRALACVPR